MAFDALVLAHCRDDDELLKMLPEYNRDPSTKKRDEHHPRRDWIRNVDAFVTLGSPIDKYLVLWWHNYEHLVPPRTTWVDEQLLGQREGKFRMKLGR